MLTEFMASRRIFGSLSVFVAGLGLALLVSACEKVPLLAPTGSTITLTSSINALPVNGTTDIIAQVLEAAGTPPHSGTLITFTTTLGTIEPSDARTDIGGRVIVKFRAGSGNGTATITASSGGATTGTNGAVRISIGTAAVGAVTLSASPNPVSAGGGVSTITANVRDVNGNALPFVPVNFSTTAGSLGNAQVNTDANGLAQTTLTTSAQATVTGTVGAQAPSTPSTGSGGTTAPTTGTQSGTVQVNVNPLPTVSISPPSGTLTAGSPIVFTISAQPGPNSTAQIRNVVVNFGDGTSRDLGAVSGTGITVQHRYDDDDEYTVRVTVTDSLGGLTSAATVIVVQPQPPLSVIISQSSAVSGGDRIYTFTATVTPNTATVSSYNWNFGDGTSQSTTSPQTTHPYVIGSGAKTVTVGVVTTTGQTASGTTVVSP
jgi:adhesin/invasin